MLTNPGASSDDGVAPPEKIVMVRGGIERYLRTFPDGGYWRGANYLFDRRFEQRPPDAPAGAAPLGNCAACLAPCDEYRGKFACSEKDCRVPVIVCARCRDPVFKDPKLRPDLAKRLKCRLCREDYAGARATPLPACVLKGAPDLAVEKAPPKKTLAPPRKYKAPKPPSSILFVGNLPLTCERSEVLDALSLDRTATKVVWLVDKQSQLFYGSALVHCADVKTAARLLAKPKRVRGRKLRVGFGPAATPADDDAGPGPVHDGPRPPCGGAPPESRVFGKKRVREEEHGAGA